MHMYVQKLIQLFVYSISSSMKFIYPSMYLSVYLYYYYYFPHIFPPRFPHLIIAGEDWSKMIPSRLLIEENKRLIELQIKQCH